jgi:hypothetical protein
MGVDNDMPWLASTSSCHVRADLKRIPKKGGSIAISSHSSHPTVLVLRQVADIRTQKD